MLSQGVGDLAFILVRVGRELPFHLQSATTPPSQPSSVCDLMPTESPFYFSCFSCVCVRVRTCGVCVCSYAFSCCAQLDTCVPGASGEPVCRTCDPAARPLPSPEVDVTLAKCGPLGCCPAPELCWDGALGLDSMLCSAWWIAFTAKLPLPARSGVCWGLPACSWGWPSGHRL